MDLWVRKSSSPDHKARCWKCGALNTVVTVPTTARCGHGLDINTQCAERAEDGRRFCQWHVS